MENNIINYILKNGKQFNYLLKYSIDSDLSGIEKLLLIDYILDTIKNYNHVNCPDYIEDNTPIIPGEIIQFLLITEDDDFAIATEDDFALIGEFSEVQLDTDYIETENSKTYVQSENDFNKHIFDIKRLEAEMNKLIKDLNCYE